jgi:hypothetical protein
MLERTSSIFSAPYWTLRSMASLLISPSTCFHQLPGIVEQYDNERQATYGIGFLIFPAEDGRAGSCSMLIRWTRDV